MNALSYQQCYKILDLQDHADWHQAETSYRQLVQRWHPDRYEGDDPAQATRQYIEITKAFKKLRDFHKDNSTLPFSSVGDTSAAPTSEKSQNRVADNKQTHNPAAFTETIINEVENNTTKGRVTNVRWNNKENFRPSRFTLVTGAVFVVGVSLILLFVTKLDKINSDRYRDEARLERISERLAEQPDTYQ